MKKILLLIALFEICIVNYASAWWHIVRQDDNCRAGKGGCWIIKKSMAPQPGLNGQADYISKGLIMVFSESDMDAQDKKEFSGGVFMQKTDVMLNEELREALKAPKGYTIHKGNYKIIKEGKTYRIDFGNGFAIKEQGTR